MTRERKKSMDTVAQWHNGDGERERESEGEREREGARERERQILYSQLLGGDPSIFHSRP